VRRCVSAGALCLLATLAFAADPPGTAVSFLACPIARDTGPDTDVCFFAEHEGTRYALVNPPDWGVPQLKHRVLVEGRIKEGASYCGAIPIEGRTSVMTELDNSCNVLVPFDGVIKGVAGGVFNNGTPQQRALAQDLARRAALDPRLSIEPAIAETPAPVPPAAPFERRTQTILYPFDSDRASGPDMVKLKEMALLAQAAKAGVTVVGYRATSHLSDGNDLAERPQMARIRATKIAGILAALGVDAKHTRVSWEDSAIEGSGNEDWRNRKVEIIVDPQPPRRT
jgi:hypothetical protein